MNHKGTEAQRRELNAKAQRREDGYWTTLRTIVFLLMLGAATVVFTGCRVVLAPVGLFMSYWWKAHDDPAANHTETGSKTNFPATMK